MATRKKKELDIEIPASLSTTMPKVSVDPTTDMLRNQLIELNNNIKVLNENMEKIHTLTYSSDWKLWKIMNMIELIAKESGYVFSTDNSQEKENVK
jgi:hypothetical protein